MGPLVREAMASARSQAVTSLLTLVMVAVMCASALLTSGRTVATEDAVLAHLDAAGTRSIIVRAADGAGLTVAAVSRIARIIEAESVTGFGPVVDVRNTRIPGGTPVGLRAVYGLGSPGQVRATPRAAQALGLRDGTGEVVTADDHRYLVTGTMALPSYLGLLGSVILESREPAGGEEVDLIVVLATEPRLVRAVAETVAGLLAAADPTKISIETSATLADVRAAIGGELGRYGRATVLGVLAITALLHGANLLALVYLRRKDFGRRRALGATRGLIVSLLLTQAGILAVIGAGLGIGVASAVVARSGAALPNAQYCLALAVAGLLVTLVAALVPALVASRRQPLQELRVP
ncbi:MAG: lipoprotein ABC transporter permease [Actinomycetia bacterium]|nr:lipoprotein ABC transporter permease [Actinomycetes bacterium]